MGITSIFSKFKTNYKQHQYAKMLNGSTPIFSQFGEDIYASDIVKNCVRCIATELSKLQPKHIRIDKDMQITVNSDINRLLKFAPNPLMTTSEFLEKITWLREQTYNCFIYPQYDIVENHGKSYRKFTGFYPLNPIQVDFMQDITNKLFIKMYFSNGSDYTLPYEDVIHWRKDFSMNELMGGNKDGKADNRPLLNLLNINNTVMQGLPKAVKSSLSVRGIIKINSMLANEKQEKEMKDFEKALKSSESGILPMDLKCDYIPINTNPQIIDKDTLEFIERKILNNYGVSMAIINGDFTDEQYQAFYEKTLEPLINSLGQVFSKTLFTEREQQCGNEIIFYPQKLLFTNTKNKIAVADILGNRGALTDNQLLDLFGYPPFEGGDIRHISLNFINREIADEYQMAKTKNGKEVS